MTLTLLQLIEMLRNAIKEEDLKDVILFQDILKRTIKGHIMLEVNEEIKQVIRMANEFINLEGPDHVYLDLY